MLKTINKGRGGVQNRDGIKGQNTYIDDFINWKNGLDQQMFLPDAKIQKSYK